MKELLELIFHLKFKALFFENTDNGFIKFFRYCFVGGIAFIADYAAFSAVCLIFGDKNIITYCATAVGFFVGLIVNFMISKKFVFTENANVSKQEEFLVYAVIGAVGLVLNMLLMKVFAYGLFKINKYIAKLVVSMIVLVYNYAARKILLYSKSSKS